MTFPPKGLLQGLSGDSQGQKGADAGHGLHIPKDLGGLAQLLFEWPIRQAPRLALPGCILAAAVIQAGMIILFSISYTTPSDNVPQAPQIYFLVPDSVAARQLAPWLAANDPAVFSPQYATRAALPAPPPLKYRPSYEEPPPPLLPLPVDPARAVEPPPIPLMTDMLKKKSLREKAASLLAPDQSAPALPRTLVRWQDGLAARVPVAPAAGAVVLQPVAASLPPALYEVGVSAEGIPMHCVLLDSTGDPASDETGSVWIHAQRFQPAAQESWGRVLIIWGAPVEPPGGAKATRQPSRPFPATPIPSKP